MPLYFARIKEIKLTDVLARYKVALRFKSDYAVCACPLPTHKQGDTAKSFSINLAGNYWRCFSESCNANSGGKRGGDVINFVALKEGISQLDAAKKLASWFGIGESPAPSKTQTKTAEPIAQRSNETQMQGSNQNFNGSGENIKYTDKVRAWFDSIWLRGKEETDEEHRKRLLKSITSELIRNYQSGKSGKVL